MNSKTGRLKAQFEKKKFPASLGSTIIVNGVGLLNFVMFVCGYGTVTFRKKNLIVYWVGIYWWDDHRVCQSFRLGLYFENLPLPCNTIILYSCVHSIRVCTCSPVLVQMPPFGCLSERKQNPLTISITTLSTLSDLHVTWQQR